MTIQTIISQLTLELTQAQNKNEQANILKLIDFLSKNQNVYNNDFDKMLESITDNNKKYEAKFKTRVSNIKQNGVALFLPVVELKLLANCINEYIYEPNNRNLMKFVERHKNDNILFEDNRIAYAYVGSYALLKDTFITWEKLTSIIDPQVETALSNINDKSSLNMITLANIVRYLEKHPTASSTVKILCNKKIDELKIDKEFLKLYDLTNLFGLKCKRDEEMRKLYSSTGSTFNPTIDNVSIMQIREEQIQKYNNSHKNNDLENLQPYTIKTNTSHPKLIDNVTQEVVIIQNQNKYSIKDLEKEVEKVQ